MSVPPKMLRQIHDSIRARLLPRHPLVSHGGTYHQQASAPPRPDRAMVAGSRHHAIVRSARTSVKFPAPARAGCSAPQNGPSPPASHIALRADADDLPAFATDVHVLRVYGFELPPVHFPEAFLPTSTKRRVLNRWRDRFRYHRVTPYAYRSRPQTHTRPFAEFTASCGMQ